MTVKCGMNDNELIANLQILNEENKVMNLLTENHRKLNILSSTMAVEIFKKG